MPAIYALFRALLVWLLLMAAESLHGVLRRVLFNPDIEFLVRQVSVLAGSVIIFAITWACIGWLRIRTSVSALAVGGLWVVLTLIFEIAIGRAMGLGWNRIASDYDLLHGGLMPLGLLAMALTPWAVRRLKARQARKLFQRLEPATSVRNTVEPGA